MTVSGPTLRRVDTSEPSLAAPPAGGANSPLDRESSDWLQSLRAEGVERDEAVARLHGLLLRAARFEVGRRGSALPHLRGNELDDIALEAANDALLSVLAHLDDFRGLSRFTTWVYKFAILEAAVKLRRRAWQGREVPLEPETWELFSSAGPQPERAVELRELVEALQDPDRTRALASPTPRAHRAGGQRRPDRRSRGTSQHDARSPVQDAARRSAQAAAAADRRRSRP